MALGRIGTFLTSEDLPEAYPIDQSAEFAVHVDGDFVWETAGKPVTEAGGKFGAGKPGKGGGRGPSSDKKGQDKKALSEKEKKWWQRKDKAGKESVLPSNTDDVEKEKYDADEDEDSKEKISDGEDSKAKPAPAEKEKEKETPFELKNLKFDIPKGSFIGIVGRVGSGKVSIDALAISLAANH